MKKEPELTPRPLDEEAIRRIGGKLREEYNSVASEPVPTRFTELLERLEKAETQGADTSSDGSDK